MVTLELNFVFYLNYESHTGLEWHEGSYVPLNQDLYIEQ